MTSSEEWVSVVVPAYNAEATVDETLQSVRSQTHRRLEILVVDDGSRDATAAIVERHAAADTRVRLIRQANAGVAAARNCGVLQAQAPFIAPIDADDLWAPTKIARQLQVFRERGGRTGLVYTWSALIDRASRVFELPQQHRAEGDVLRAICRANMPGNGSSVMMRKAAVLEAGLYDPSLRARKAEGCEDISLYQRVAESCEFGLVPEGLTGYRQLPMSMSGDALQMLRSWRIVEAEIRSRQPQCGPELDAACMHVTRWLMNRAYDSGRYRAAWQLAALLDSAAVTEVARMLYQRLDRRMQRAAPGAAGAGDGLTVGSRFPIGEL